MRRPVVHLHLGLPGSGAGFLETALFDHADALAAQGVAHPVLAPDEMFRAAVEIRRDHHAWGYRRRDVEGTWAEICRRVHKTRGRAVLGQELLTSCTDDQADLLLDTLAGAEVHAIITARRADVERHEFTELTGRWRRALGRRNHLHTLVVPAYVEPLGWIWSELGGLVGFDADRLPLDADTAVAAYELMARREHRRAAAAEQPEVSGAARRPRRRSAR